MGKWSQKQLRGGGGQGTRLPTFVALSTAGIDGLFWDYTGIQPYAWAMEFFDTGNNEWEPASTFPGATLAWANPDIEGAAYRVFGVTSGNKRISNISNIVTWSP